MKAAFEKRLVEKMDYVRALKPMDPSSNFGPLVSEIHYKKVLNYINHGIEVDKARLLYGGPSKPTKIPSGYENGFWVRPTVFTDCTDNMKIAIEEIFGPVLCILMYETVDEAVTRANNTKLGLAAGVFGKDLNKCHEVISKLEAGITWINTWGESPAEMSVGGWKLSGVGVENGRRGLNAWVRERSTLVEGSGAVGTVFAKL
jgi:betaine-aldehyde dehydrogenase